MIAGFPAQVASLAGAARRIPDRGVRRLPPGSCAGVARRVSDLRHPGRHADRSADRGNGPQLRHRRAARAVAAAGTRAQLLPQPAAEGGHLRRGDAGRARPAHRYAATCLSVPAPRRSRCWSCWAARPGCCRRGRRTRPRWINHRPHSLPMSGRRSRSRSIRSPSRSLPGSPRCSIRRAPCRLASTPHRPRFQWFPGLSQTGKLGAGAREVYHHAPATHPAAAR